MGTLSEINVYVCC